MAFYKHCKHCFPSFCVTSKKEKKTNLNSKFHKIVIFFSQADLHPRNFLPCLILCVYSFAGAGIFYSIESVGFCPVEFWPSLFFVLTVYTAVVSGLNTNRSQGEYFILEFLCYGNIHPCTTGGKVFVIIYGMFGIPLALLVLDNLGRMLAAYASYIWMKSNLCLQFVKYRVGSKRTTKLSDKNATKDVIAKLGESEDVLQGLPISIGVLITIFWILISAACFFTLETRLPFGDAVYFMFISVTTIGFGDIIPVHYEFLLIIGLSLFSMCINIVQLRVELLTENIVETIVNEYKVSLLTTDNERNQSTSMINSLVKEHIDELISKQPNGRFLKYLLGKKARQMLVSLLEKKINMRSKSSQTEILKKDAECTTRDWSNLKRVRVQTNVTVQKWDWLK